MLLLCALVVGSSNLWAQLNKATVYYESFGSTGTNTAFASYSGYSATTSMFSTSGAVNSHYSGDGSVGKNNLKGNNLSSGYTGASGLSGCYQSGTAGTTSTIIQISNIKISGYKDLSLSFGALGNSTSHKVSVSYIIDGGSETTLINNGSITNANWTLLSQDITGTGSSLTLIFKHKPTNNWLIRLDDIKVVGTPTITPAKTYTTYVPAVDLDFTSTNKLTAYIATAATSSAVTLTSVDKVPEGTPIVLKATETGSAIAVNVAASTDDVTGNLLEAGDGTTTIGGDTKYDYILSDGKFYRAEEGTVAVGKAYLHLDADPGAHALDIFFEESGDVTGVMAVAKPQTTNNASFFDLQGRRVAQPTKGLYIVNGKKVIVK